MTAGILCSRRMLRAAPLPNVVRVVATSLVTVMELSYVAWCGSARWCGAHTRVGLACHLTAVGLDAGRGTTPVTGVASASTLKIGASGATASITDFCITWFEPNQLQSCSVPRRCLLYTSPSPRDGLL